MCPRPRRRWPSPPPPLLLSPPPGPMSWMPWPEERERSRTALSHQLSLERELASALKHVESGELDAGALKSALLSSKDHAHALGGYFSDHLCHNAEFYNERNPEGSTVASTVFNIPELLEMILEHISIVELLNFYQVNSSIRDTIDASSKLQTQLSLRAMPADSHLRFPLRNLTRYVLEGPEDFGRIDTVGFSCYEYMSRRYRRSRDPDIALEQRRTIEIHASFSTLPGQRLSAIGSRIRQMFTCQPPIEEMSVSLDCCPNYDFSVMPGTPREEQKIFRAGGLRVGDLYECAKKLLDEHRFCPNAYSGQLDNDGTVRVGVRFVGKRVLQEDDPINIKYRKEEERKAQDDRHYRLQSAKLEAFCNARKRAHQNNEPIPTLAEFVASHGEDTDWVSLAWPSPPQFSNWAIAPPIPPPPPAPPTTAQQIRDDFDFDAFLAANPISSSAAPITSNCFVQNDLTTIDGTVTDFPTGQDSQQSSSVEPLSTDATIDEIGMQV